MNLVITATAENFIRRMIRMGGTADAGFRLVVTAGGCSGLAGDFAVESAPRAGDVVFDHHGMRLFLPAPSRLLLDGVTIDFADTATQTGLVFQNPKAPIGSCGTSAPGLPGVASISLASIGRRRVASPS
jgi:iron-sulfur cluster assembly accessory protein